MSRIGAELALGMSLALESSEADIERALALLDERTDEAEAREMALQILARARRRIETVRLALGEAGQFVLS